MSNEYEELVSEIKALRREVANLSKLTAPFGVYMGDGTVLTQISSGLRFYVYSDDQILLPKLIGNRIWEPSVTRHFHKHLQRDKDLIDVGANIGYFSCLGASLLDRSCAQVFAFEPNPRALTLLKRNVAINWSIAKIDILEFALSDTEGEIVLYAPRRMIGNASLYDMRSEDGQTEDDSVDAVSVEMRRLDDLIKEKGRVGTIKIDVEGAEYQVIAGAQEVLEASPTCEIVMEWSQSQLRRSPNGVESLLSFFDDHSLVVREIGKDNDDPLSLSDLQKIEYTNIFVRRT